MIHRNKITEIAFKIIKPKNDGLKSFKIMHPHREWGVGLLVAVLIFAASSFWSAKTYLEYRDVSFAEEEGSVAAAPVYRATLVENAFDIFAGKNIKFKNLTDFSSVPDSGILEVSTSTTVLDLEDNISTTTDSINASSETEAPVSTTTGENINEMPAIKMD